MGWDVTESFQDGTFRDSVEHFVDVPDKTNAAVQCALYMYGFVRCNGRPTHIKGTVWRDFRPKFFNRTTFTDTQSNIDFSEFSQRCIL